MFSSGFSGAKSLFQRPAHRAMDSLSAIFAKEEGGKTEKETALHVVSLISAVALADGKIDEQEVEELRRYLFKKLSKGHVEELINIFKEGKSEDAESAAKALSKLSEDEKISIVSALMDIAYSNNDYTANQRKVIIDISRKLGFDDAVAEELEIQCIEYRKRRDSFLKSSAGIIVALIIISIFILAATFLKSVLFGLILAYFFLPLERWFEHKFFKFPMIKAISGVFSRVMAPVLSMPGKVKKAFARKTEMDEEPDEKSVELKRREFEVSRACSATVFAFVSCALGVLFLFLFLSASYVTNMGKSMKKWADLQVKQAQKAESQATKTGGKKEVVKTSLESKYASSFIAQNMHKLESYKPRLEKIPFFNWAVRKVKEFLQNDKERDKLIEAVLSKSGGVFSFTAGFVGNVFAVLLNIMLSIFFFSLFLQKIAISSSSSARPGGGNIVQGIFSSKWMPQTNRKTREEAASILDNIILKLRAWVRGYLSIIIIESIVYITIFSIIGVPYSFVLGFLAGCTVLLPYIGPVSSALLTTVVCLAAGGPSSMLIIVIVILVYIIMNGIVEQLFLYPALVGNALGLTTIETIIVVLLGGLFAGFSGMIFAVPAAATLKYLVPKIYNCWQ